MGADGFVVYYGLRWEIGTDDRDVNSLLQRQQEPRQLAADRHALDHWYGGSTEQGGYYLLIGKLVANLGFEGDESVQLGDAEAASFVRETKEKLRLAGFTDEPAWHYQFEPDF